MTRTAYRSRGFSVLEMTASLAIFLPLLIAIVFVILEGSYAYLIKNCLSQSARQAARDLAIAYGDFPEIASDRQLQNQMVFDKIRMTSIINSSEQFSTPMFNAEGEPPTVSVNVSYQGTQYGLPPFPHVDPLNLGQGFCIDGTATYRLE